MDFMQYLHGVEREKANIPVASRTAGRNSSFTTSFGSLVMCEALAESSREAGTSRCVTGRDATPRMQVRDHIATDWMHDSRAAVMTTGNVGETFSNYRDVAYRVYRELVLQFTQAEALRLQNAETQRKIRESHKRQQRIKQLERELNDIRELEKDEERCRATDRSGAPYPDQFGYGHHEPHGDMFRGQTPSPPCIDLDRNGDANRTNVSGDTTTHTCPDKRHNRAVIHNTHNLKSFTNTINATLHTNTVLEDTYIEAHHRFWLRPAGLKDATSGGGATFERQELIEESEALESSESGAYFEPCVAIELEEVMPRLSMKPWPEELQQVERSTGVETKLARRLEPCPTFVKEQNFYPGIQRDWEDGVFCVVEKGSGLVDREGSCH